MKRMFTTALLVGLLSLGALAAPVDVVINPKKSLLTAEFPALLGEVAGAFEKISKQSRESNQPPVAGRQQEGEGKR